MKSLANLLYLQLSCGYSTLTLASYTLYLLYYLGRVKGKCINKELVNQRLINDVEIQPKNTLTDYLPIKVGRYIC